MRMSLRMLIENFPEIKKKGEIRLIIIKTIEIYYCITGNQRNDIILSLTSPSIQNRSQNSNSRHYSFIKAFPFFLF